MRCDGEGADARERVSEEAMGEIGVGDGRGLFLDGPVTKEIGAVFEEKRNQFVVEVVPVGECGEDRGEARGGERLDVLGAERGIRGEGDAHGFVGEGDKIVGDVRDERRVRGEGDADGEHGRDGRAAFDRRTIHGCDAGAPCDYVIGLGEVALERGGELGTRGDPNVLVGFAMGDDVEQGDGVGLEELAGDAANRGVR